VLNGLRNLYKKIGASAGLLSGLRTHDEQIAQLRASLATLLAEKRGLSPEEKARAKAEIESLLAYQAVSKDETERLRALYESAAARVAATETEIAALREKLIEMENGLRGRGGRP
jgi:chromosome segregation ATPase